MIKTHVEQKASQVNTAAKIWNFLRPWKTKGCSEVLQGISKTRMYCAFVDSKLLKLVCACPKSMHIGFVITGEGNAAKRKLFLEGGCQTIYLIFHAFSVTWPNYAFKDKCGSRHISPAHEEFILTLKPGKMNHESLQRMLTICNVAKSCAIF